MGFAPIAGKPDYEKDCSLDNYGLDDEGDFDFVKCDCELAIATYEE